MKRIRPNEDFSIFDEVLKNTPEEEKIFVSRSLEIANQIISVLEDKGLMQKDLATKLGKSEPEISKWLSGFHNFTIKSLSKIEAVLETQIIITPKQARIEITKQITDDFKQHAKRIIESIKSERNAFVHNTNTCVNLKFHSKNVSKVSRPCKVVDMGEFQKAKIETQTSQLQSTGS